MPSQSGEDAVSTALQFTFSPAKYRSKMGEITTPSSSSGSLSCENRIMPTVTEVLQTSIKYTNADECYNPSGLYTKLKEKYTVLTANNQVDSGNSSVQSSSSTSTTNSSSSSTSYATPSSVRSLSNSPEKKSQQQVVPSSTISQQSKSSTTTPSLPLPKKVLYPPNLICLGWKGSVPVGAGFVNLGNTCYLNSALQALLHVPAFVNWLQSDKIHTSQCESLNGVTHSECLICAMSKILQNTHKNTGSAIKPSYIYSKLKDICKHLVHGHQEDAHEFLRYLIEGMERCYLTIFNGMRLDSYSKETTPLNQIFGGYMRTEVTCLECGYVSTTFQHFQDILLDIRQANSVEEALESYFSRERLGDGDQAYKCGQCKKRAAATKKFSIERPPNALCIQLKRFNAMGGKNNKHVSVKQTLDMTRYVHPSHPPGCSLTYKLVSMVNHLGQSANCGHYTAIGQSAAGSYYHFDDSIVRPVALQNVLNTNAYIIMYELASESVREKLIEKIPVETNGVKMEINENLSSQSQSALEKKVTDDNEIAQRLTKHIQSPADRATKGITENGSSSSSSSTSPKKSNKNCLNPKENNKSGAVDPSTPGVSSNVECSLVPYLSESSESESGCETVNSVIQNSSNAQYNKGKIINRVKPPDDRTKKENSLESSDSVEKKTGNGCEDTGSGWQVTPDKKDSHSEKTSSTSTTSGKWSVVRIQERETWKRETNNEGEKRQNSSSSSTVVPNTKESGVKMESNKNHSPNNSARSPSASPASTIQSLLDMSHQGYGSSNVNSWNGNKSKMSKDIERDRMQMKRSFSNYNDDPDRGKMKKKRYHKNSSIENDCNHSWNRMQEFQNRKNCWSGPLNGSSRQNFYRQYTYEKSKGHSNHHPHYRGIGGNYYRGGAGGNGFPLTMMSPSLLYKKPHCT